MWKVTISGEDVFVDCKERPTCYLCGAELVPWNVKKLKFSSVPYSGDYDCRAVDIETVCSNCCCEEIFGIAVTHEEFEKANIMELIFQ